MVYAGSLEKCGGGGGGNGTGVGRRCICRWVAGGAPASCQNRRQLLGANEKEAVLVLFVLRVDGLSTFSAALVGLTEANARWGYGFGIVTAFRTAMKGSFMPLSNRRRWFIGIMALVLLLPLPLLLNRSAKATAARSWRGW